MNMLLCPYIDVNLEKGRKILTGVASTSESWDGDDGDE